MDQDPFDLLAIPPAFRLDEAGLQRAWLRASARLHPDRSPDPDAASEAIARLNDAKRMLADPESRARALLKRLDPQAASDDRSLPDGFLVEMLEVRQAIDEARDARDQAEFERLEEWAVGQREAYIESVASHFAEYEQTQDPESLKDIRRLLNAWRYIERMLEQMDPSYDPNSADFRGSGA